MTINYNEQWVDELVTILCGRTPKWDDYILPPTKDRMVHDITVVRDTHTPLSQREFEQVQVDGGSCGDEFGWYYNRDIPLSLADAEETIAYMERRLKALKGKMLYHHYVPNGTRKVDMGDGRWKTEKRKTYVASDAAQEAYNEGLKAKAELEAYVAKIDASYQPATHEDIDCPSEGQAMYTFLDMYIDTLSTTQLAVAMDVLEAMKASKDISWYYYVQCGLAVSGRLWKQAPLGGWDTLFNNLLKHKDAHHRDTPTYEDRFYGEMSFDMESAIDQKRLCEQLAIVNGRDVQDMWYEMCEDMEASGMGLPQEGYSADLDPDHIDILVDSWEDFILNKEGNYGIDR